VVHVLSVEIGADDSVFQSLSRLGSSQSPMYELPTCPVCLERMDSAITGLITVPCSHTFHCTCLSKWGDSRCVLMSTGSMRVPILNSVPISQMPLSVGIHKPSCPRTPFHQLPLLCPCPSPTPPHRCSLYAPHVHQV
jgi:hypothetical protein